MGIQFLLPEKKGHSSPPVFGPCLLWPNGRPSQQLLNSCYQLVMTPKVYFTVQINSPKYTTPRSKPPTLLATSALSSTNTSPFQARFHLSWNIAVSIFTSAVSALTSVSKQPLLPPQSFNPNSMNAVLFTTTFLSLRQRASSRSWTFFHVLLSRLRNPVIPLESLALSNGSK